MKFRKLPVIIEAIRVKDVIYDSNVPMWVFEDNKVELYLDHIDIVTLEGTMRAELEDWIIKGVQGELYPCKPDIFASTYEKVEENDEV